MKEISITGFSLTTMCRLCLSRGVTLLDLFSYTEDLKNSVANTVMNCAPVQIKKCDGMPNFICEKCYTRLEKTHQFQMQIVQSEKTLQRYLEQLHGYDTQSKLESSSQRPSNDSLADNTNADITVKREFLELHNVLSDEECGNFNSARKNNRGLLFKNKIKDEPTNNNSLNPEECAGIIVKAPSTQGCEGSDINTENNLLKVGELSNFDLQCGSNEEMSTKFEIKDEQMDDNNALIDAESADDVMQTLFEDSGDEISCEDWKIDIGDTIFIEGIDANWKKNEPSNLNSAKIEDSSLILTDCINDTANDKRDSEISYKNTKIGFGNASACLRSSDLDDHFELFEEENMSASIRSEKHKQKNSMKPHQLNVNETCSSRRESDTNSILHTGEKSHENNVCSENFTKTSILNTHKLTQKGKKHYKCDVCNKFFKRPKQLKIHQRVHTGERPYQCDVCKKCFTQLSNLNTHKLTHTDEKPYKCDVCNKCYCELRCLKNHKRTHTNEKPYKCDVCNKCFNYSGNLKTHKRTHTDEKPYKCVVCNKCFTQLGSLKNHKLTHTNEKPYKCDVCNKCFNYSCNLKTHERIHTDEKPYKCVVCNKCFTQLSILNNHKLTHTDEKPYKCDVCKKSFKRPDELKIHQRIHTGERPYQCDVCNKCFNYSCNLKIHKRIHTDEKPYKCVVCNKCFTLLSNLNKHKLTHTDEKPYKCDVCKKSFKRPDELKIHQRIHTGERPYQCDVCNKCFSQWGSLNKHKLTHTDDKTLQV